MNEDIGHVAEKLQHTANYPMLFFNAFGDSIINGEKLLSALAQFELTIESTNSKYDSVMRKQAVFTAQENNGYQLYKANCSSCHAEPLFTNNAFENNGLPIDSNLNDLGRMSVTMNADDSLKFKVPSLRNLEYSYPYMHDGRFKKLKDVLDHYTAGIQKSKTLSEKLQKPIVLSSNERVDLIAFLLTLTDRDFLFNKKYMNPATAMIP
jgi:cytochrome c peroxidase